MRYTLAITSASSWARAATPAPIEVRCHTLRQALAKSPPGGNGFVRAGVVAVTAPSWRGNCGPVSSVMLRASLPGEQTRLFERRVGIDNSPGLRYDKDIKQTMD
jgi:hypothetical protein